jgi:hypothetical protein
MKSHAETDATWKPLLFGAAYLSGTVGATIGWLIAIGWAGFSVLRRFV